MVVLFGEDPGGEECCSSPTGKQPPGQGLQLARPRGAKVDHGNCASCGSPARQAEGGGTEEEEEEDYEDLEDFSELPDTHSIASDDSFYPPLGGCDDDDDDWSLGESEPDSPEPLSLFRACCTNNAVVLRALIRQGPEEDEVRETDHNKRIISLLLCRLFPPTGFGCWHPFQEEIQTVTPTLQGHWFKIQESALVICLF
ncbi:UNVERIFIED_CONTAM: hypothetical protein K2H54_004365 [Gekko kuhli]